VDGNLRKPGQEIIKSACRLRVTHGTERTVEEVMVASLDENSWKMTSGPRFV